MIVNEKMKKVKWGGGVQKNNHLKSINHLPTKPHSIYGQWKKGSFKKNSQNKREQSFAKKVISVTFVRISEKM